MNATTKKFVKKIAEQINSVNEASAKIAEYAAKGYSADSLSHPIDCLQEAAAHRDAWIKGAVVLTAMAKQKKSDVDAKEELFRAVSHSMSPSQSTSRAASTRDALTSWARMEFATWCCDHEVFADIGDDFYAAVVEGVNKHFGAEVLTAE